MTDLPPPPTGAAPPPPPSSIRAAPPAPNPTPGSARYRVIPLVIPLISAMIAHLATKLWLTARSGERIDIAREFVSGAIDQDTYEDRIGALNGIGTISSLAANVVIVLSVIVLYRILANLRALGRDTAWSPVWAIFGWVLPPGLWVIPALFTAEAWKASSSSAEWRRERTNPLIWAWAATYTAATVLGAIGGFRVAMALIDLDDLAGSDDVREQAQAMIDNAVIANIGELVTVAAGVLWIIVIRQLSERHARFTGEKP